MVDDLTIGRNGIKAGLIGEVGCQYPIADVERKSLIASGIAQVHFLIRYNCFPKEKQQLMSNCDRSRKIRKAVIMITKTRTRIQRF